MLQETLFGALVSTFIDKLLPGRANAELRNKQKLGAFLLKIAALLDSYLAESGRVRELLESDESASSYEWRDELFAGIDRLSGLTAEFASLVREVGYLRLFDEALGQALHTTAVLEKGAVPSWETGYPSGSLPSPVYRDVGLVDAVRLNRLARPPRDPEVVRCYSMVTHEESGESWASPAPREFDLTASDGRREFVEFLWTLRGPLQDAYDKVAAFLRENFAPWELFPVRSSAPAPPEP